MVRLLYSTPPSTIHVCAVHQVMSNSKTFLIMGWHLSHVRFNPEPWGEEHGTAVFARPVTVMCLTRVHLVQIQEAFLLRQILRYVPEVNREQRPMGRPRTVSESTQNLPSGFYCDSSIQGYVQGGLPCTHTTVSDSWAVLRMRWGCPVGGTTRQKRCEPSGFKMAPR